MSKNIGITAGAFSGSFFRIANDLETYPQLIQTEDEIKNIDLLILPGGADINPELYGQKNTHSYITQYSIVKDLWEIKAFRAAITLGKKVLGVCRGHQLINAALGGILVQEIGLIKRHENRHLLTEKEGIIGKFFDTVNSIHHQGVLTPGKGLSITSKYGGVIESTENNQIISVQFHPEVMEKQSSLEFFQYVLKDWS